MNFACITGMIGAVLFGMWGLAGPNLMLVIIAIFGFNTCMMMRRQLVAAGPYAFEEETTYAAAYEPLTPKRRAPSKWVVRKQAKAAQSERAEQQKIDDILAKVHAYGMNSLNWLERRTLKRATERQRQRDAAHARRTR
jgi:predicted lipid-binding transport protein (Tim44 family)